MRAAKSRLWAMAIFIGLLLAVLLAYSTAAVGEQRAKNVIVLIVAGCSSEQYTLARWYKQAPLSFDSLLVGALKTYISDSVVADSAVPVVDSAAPVVSGWRLPAGWPAAVRGIWF